MKFGSGAVVYNLLSTEPEDGWNVKDGRIVIGDGIDYKPNVNTRISWFLSAPDSKKIVMEIQGNYFTEPENDIFSCSYFNKKGAQVPLLGNGVSGVGSLREKWTMRHNGRPLEVQCTFTSDELLSGTGVFISSVRFTAS